MVVPASAALHQEILNAVDSRKAIETVMMGAITANMTDGRVFQEVVGFPSERYTTNAAPADEANTQKMARRMGHCDCLTICERFVYPFGEEAFAIATLGFFCSILTTFGEILQRRAKVF